VKNGIGTVLRGSPEHRKRVAHSNGWNKENSRKINSHPKHVFLTISTKGFAILAPQTTAVQSAGRRGRGGVGGD
jgi:hypothetical protein